MVSFIKVLQETQSHSEKLKEMRLGTKIGDKVSPTGRFYGRVQTLIGREKDKELNVSLCSRRRSGHSDISLLRSMTQSLKPPQLMSPDQILAFDWPPENQHRFSLFVTNKLPVCVFWPSQAEALISGQFVIVQFQKLSNGSEV